MSFHHHLYHGSDKCNSIGTVVLTPGLFQGIQSGLITISLLESCLPWEFRGYLYYVWICICMDVCMYGCMYGNMYGYIVICMDMYGYGYVASFLDNRRQCVRYNQLTRY